MTVLSEAPDDVPGWLPAAEKAIGTMLAMPSPAKPKAAMASQGSCEKPAMSMPAAAARLENRKVRTAPNRLRTLSPTKRISAIAPEKAAKPRPAVARSDPRSSRR